MSKSRPVERAGLTIPASSPFNNSQFSQFSLLSARGTQRNGTRCERALQNAPFRAGARIALARRSFHGRRRSASITIAPHAAPKIATNRRSPSSNARLAAPHATRERPNSSLKPGSIRGAFILLALTAPRPAAFDRQAGGRPTSGWHRHVRTCHDSRKEIMTAKPTQPLSLGSAVRYL